MCTDVDSLGVGLQVRAVSNLKKSPLDAIHRESGGRMIPFAGWEMPESYHSAVEEHQAVREGVGQFDISHLGQIFVEGKDAEKWLNSFLTNDVTELADGQGHYTFFLNEEGCIIDDLMLYRLRKEAYFLVVNASCLTGDVAWLESLLIEGISVRDESAKSAAIAVQGPKSVDVFSRVFGGRTLPSQNRVDELTLDGQSLWVCRTGYTGEDGFEFFCPKRDAERWWEEFEEVGAKPCGLSARDSLRVEKCYPRNGWELDSSHTPLEVGLGSCVKLEKDEFIGKEALLAAMDGELSGQQVSGKQLVAILCDEGSTPLQEGDRVYNESGEEIGVLSSGILSPTLSVGIGMSYLSKRFAGIGTKLFINSGGNKVSAKVVKKPFVA